MRLSLPASFLVIFGVAPLSLGLGTRLRSDEPDSEIAPRFVVIDLGPQMPFPVQVSDDNVVRGHDKGLAWYSWSAGVVAPLGAKKLRARPAESLSGLKLPQAPGANIVPLAKLVNVPLLRDQKGVSAKLATEAEVVGNGSGSAFLWVKGADRRSSDAFDGPIPINLLVPHDKNAVAWNITQITDINNGGTMVGTGVHTSNGPNDPIAAGPHGVMVQPMAVVREDPPGSGNFGPITDNGLDDNARLPIYATESGKGLAETDKHDDFSAAIYGDIAGPTRATLIFTLKTRFDQTDTGTLSETAAGSGIFEDRATHVRAEMNPLTPLMPPENALLNLLVTDPKLNISGDSHLLQQAAPNSSKYNDTGLPVDVILSAPLSTRATNTVTLQMSSEIAGMIITPLTETAVNSRVFKGPGMISVGITDYLASPGGSMHVAVTAGAFEKIPIQLSLKETADNSLQYSNYIRVISDEPVSTPATDGQGIFYLELAGSRPTKVTIATGASHVTVEALPVKGRPNLLRTGKLVLIEKGDPFRAPDITTIEAGDGDIDFQVEGQTVVK
jgi:hypothetical protein